MLACRVSPDRLLLRASVLSAAAGLVHGIVAPDHFAEWWGYGAFFLAASFAQVGYGAVPIFSRLVEGASIVERWPRGRVRAFAWAGIVGNVAIVALYVVTRTVGIPFFGPEAGVVEEIRALDVVSKGIELGIVVTLVLVLRQTSNA